MSLFRKEEEMQSGMPAAARPNREVPRKAEDAGITQVAKGSKFHGEITGTSDLVIAGEVEGKLIVEGTVSIQASGYVSGEIKARTIKIGGRVKGNIVGSEMIEILSQGSVQGDIKSPRVVIADSAFFKGKVEMGGDS